jgi:hypothetical protein
VAGTETKAELGIEAIALDATDDGTLVYSTTANPLEMMITYSDDKDETTDDGTTTGETQFDGIVTVAGAVT